MIRNGSTGSSGRWHGRFGMEVQGAQAGGMGDSERYVGILTGFGQWARGRRTENMGNSDRADSGHGGIGQASWAIRTVGMAYQDTKHGGFDNKRGYNLGRKYG